MWVGWDIICVKLHSAIASMNSLWRPLNWVLDFKANGCTPGAILLHFERKKSAEDREKGKCVGSVQGEVWNATLEVLYADMILETFSSTLDHTPLQRHLLTIQTLIFDR